MPEVTNVARRSRAPVLCGILLGTGAVLAVAAAVHVGMYLRRLPFAKQAIPARMDYLPLIILLLAGLAIVFTAGAWQVFRFTSVHRQISSRWSSTMMLFWAVLFAYTLILNYPLPPHVHHQDKFLLAIALLLGWTLGFLLAPVFVNRALSRRAYTVLKIVMINAVVFIVVGEAALRLADPWLARSGLFGDKHTPASLRPHVPARGSIGITNAQGFRDRERTVARGDTAPRVLALGDSMTWGAGVSYDEAFPTLLESWLKSVAPGAEVLNLGVPGWGPHEELHLLKIYGIQFHPDVVLLNFFIGNDIHNERWEDTNLTQILVVAGQSYYLHTTGNIVHDVLAPDRWYLYHELRYLWRVGSAKVGRATEQRLGGTPAGEWAPLVSRGQYVRGIRERDDIYRKIDTRMFQEHWTRTLATLLEIKRFTDQERLTLLVVLIPDHVQIDHLLQTEFLGAIHSAAEDYDFEKPQRLLRPWMHEHGMRVLDLLPVFQTDPLPNRFYFLNDYHLTAEGHRVTARAIFPLLKSRFDAPNADIGQPMTADSNNSR